MATMRAGIWTRHQHADHDLATRVTSTRDVVLLAIDQPLVAITDSTALKILGIR